MKLRKGWLIVGVGLIVLFSGVAAFAGGGGRAATPKWMPGATLTLPSTAGSSAVIPGFTIQSSAKVPDDAAVSRPGFSTADWTPVAPRSTVFAGLLAAGRYPDPFYSTALKSVDTAAFKVP